MNKFLFYWLYAARNIWRNRRWSAFAMLSIAAGVATVVALRSLGLAIGDSLTSNVRSSNHGDITVQIGSLGFFNLNIGEEERDEVFSTAQLGRLRDWTQQQGGQMSEYKFTSLQVSAADRENVGLLNFMTALFINPQTYPTTQDIVAMEPEGVPLGELFQGGADAREVVISENLAESQGIGVGDSVRVSGTDDTFIVRGIVPTEAEAGLRDLFAAFFGFVYFDINQAETVSVSPRPNRVSIALPEGTTLGEIEIAADEINTLLRGSTGFYRVISVPRLLEQNEIIADVTGRFIVVMGLGAMLLGGVGIINTMLVMVRRRTEEIAALKTFGLKGRQVALLFMSEALLLGMLGSVVGSIVGSLLSRFANAYGETFIQQSLTWRIYPEALVFGFTLGLVVTAVFGVMPVLTAVKVRPGIILRPNETHIPALGVLNSIGVTLFVVLSLGIIAGQVIGPIPERVPVLPIFRQLPIPPHMAIGIAGVTVTLLILALLVGLLWIVVWLVGRMPAFGFIDLRLALTNLRSRRLRTATTLLAISVGMFALSSITFYGAGVREILQLTLTDTFGGNVLILSPATVANVPIVAEQAQRVLDNKLDELGDAVRYRTQILNYDGTLVALDDRVLTSQEAIDERRRLDEERRAALREQDFDRVSEINEQIRALSPQFLNVSVQDSTNPDLQAGTLLAGRHLTLEDYGQPVATLLGEPGLLALGVQVGSQVTIQVNNTNYTFEIVGLIRDEDGPPSGFGDLRLPGGNLTGVRSDFRLNTIFAEPERMDEVLLAISSLPSFFPLNVRFIDGVIGRFIDQFSALPLLVGLLSLGAAAVIMANTVALATLERRKQIGILKAVGLKSKRVLSIMLLENTLVSLLGAFLGLGLSMLGVAIMTYFGLDDLVFIPADAQTVAVALVIAAAAIGSISTFLSANPAVRERVLNVLRYE